MKSGLVSMHLGLSYELLSWEDIVVQGSCHSYNSSLDDKYAQEVL